MRELDHVSSRFIMKIRSLVQLCTQVRDLSRDTIAAHCIGKPVGADRRPLAKSKT